MNLLGDQNNPILQGFELYSGGTGYGDPSLHMLYLPLASLDLENEYPSVFQESECIFSMHNSEQHNLLHIKATGRILGGSAIVNVDNSSEMPKFTLDCSRPDGVSRLDATCIENPLRSGIQTEVSVRRHYIGGYYDYDGRYRYGDGQWHECEYIIYSMSFLMEQDGLFLVGHSSDSTILLSNGRINSNPNFRKRLRFYWINPKTGQWNGGTWIDCNIRYYDGTVTPRSTLPSPPRVWRRSVFTTDLAVKSIVYPSNYILNHTIRYDWDSAFADHLDQVMMTSNNGFAFVDDLVKLPSQLRGDFEALSKLAKGAPGKLKIAAKLFLSIHYGYKLLASDARDYAKAILEFDRSHSHAVSFPLTPAVGQAKEGYFELVSAIGHNNTYYVPYGQVKSDIFALADYLDAGIDLSNIWDMIPFSFVVDWFTNIGDLAESVDAFHRLEQKHEIIGTIQSSKENYIYRIPNCMGSAKVQRYERLCSPRWAPWPKFSFQTKNPMNNLYHWLEAGSLVVATRP